MRDLLKRARNPIGTAYLPLPFVEVGLGFPYALNLQILTTERMK